MTVKQLVFESDAGQVWTGMTASSSASQLAMCSRFGAVAVASNGMTAGTSLSVRAGEMPLNGLRHPRDRGTSGWFFWGGDELSTDADFFVPVHVEHLIQWRPEIEPYLSLPAGWRFLVAPEYEDVWYDESLLEI